MTADARTGRRQKGLLNEMPHMLWYTIKKPTSGKLCLTMVICLGHYKFFGRISCVTQVFINLFECVRIMNTAEFIQPFSSGH